MGYGMPVPSLHSGPRKREEGGGALTLTPKRLSARLPTPFPPPSRAATQASLYQSASEETYKLLGGAKYSR